MDDLLSPNEICELEARHDHMYHHGELEEHADNKLLHFRYDTAHGLDPQAMGQIYLISDASELARRRALLPAGRLVETWPDLAVADHFWVGEEAKALLDGAGTPLEPKFSLDGAWVPIYYGPRLCEIESLPPEESLQARALSARGVAVAWITVNQFGERTVYEPQSPADPTFFLRRPRATTAHVWRLFRTKQEAIAYMREYYGKDPEAVEWAQHLPADNYEALIRLAS